MTSEATAPKTTAQWVIHNFQNKMYPMSTSLHSAKFPDNSKASFTKSRLPVFLLILWTVDKDPDLNKLLKSPYLDMPSC